MDLSEQTSNLAKKNLFGLPVTVILGFLAILLFMSGDGIEQAFLSKYIVQLGFSIEQSAHIFTIYGISLAIASWLAAVLTEIWGPRKVMLLGVAVWSLFEVGFLTLGLAERSFWWMYIMYGFRGFGYPLFAFSFIVWVSYVTDHDKLGAAMGWFFFMFAGGIGFVGAYYPSLFLPVLGNMGTLWSSLIWVIAGGIIGVLAVQEKGVYNERQKKNSDRPLRVALQGITILWKNPSVAAGGLLRTINTSAWYGFVVVMPIYYTTTVHFTESQWLQIWALQSVSNMLANVLFGTLGDKIGWLRVVRWFGCVGSAITVLLYYYGPVFYGNSFWPAVLIAVLFGASIGGFTPLSAVMPNLDPDNRGIAMSILNLGAGLSTFVGPALISLLNPFFGLEGVIWSIALLYLSSTGLTYVLKPRRGKQTARDEKELALGGE